MADEQEQQSPIGRVMVDDSSAGDVENCRSGGQYHTTTGSKGSADGYPVVVLPPLPPEDQYLREAGYHNVRTAKEFHDMNLSDAAAGFVSYRPITMLFRRRPFRCFAALWAAYFTAYSFLYSLGLQEVAVGGDYLLPMAVLNVAGAALLCWMAPICAMLGHPRRATLFFAAGFGWNGALSLYVWVFTGVAEEEYFFALWSFVVAFVELTVAFTFACKEHWIWNLSIFDSLLVAVVAAALIPEFGYSAIINLLAALLWIIMWSSMMIWRAWSLRQVERACKPYQVRYDEVWEPVKKTKSKELQRIAEVVNAWRHQRVIQPFYSLDLIFQRGYSLNEWYQQVVALWAEACGAKAVRAPVKSLQRTLEKVHRSYRGRVPPVIDIVRSSIVVEEIQDARKVLEHVLRSSKVHQIKNRFDLFYDSKITAGYRDLNLHITFKELLDTPFQGFVFELQIHYAPILALKSDDGHKRYIQLRNLRGD